MWCCGASLVAQMIKNLPAMQETWVGKSWEDSMEKGKGYPLQYSCLENPMDCIVYGVTKSQTQLSDFYFSTTTQPFITFSGMEKHLFSWSPHERPWLTLETFRLLSVTARLLKSAQREKIFRTPICLSSSCILYFWSNLNFGKKTSIFLWYKYI